jgi:exopolysaccharide production protein ExoY
LSGEKLGGKLKVISHCGIPMTSHDRFVPLQSFQTARSKYSVDAIALDQRRFGPLARSRKRVFDVAIAACALAFFAPVMAIIALALLVQDGRPVFYKHKRIGLNGQPFQCWKFRTMTKDAEQRLRQLLDSSEVCRQQWDTKQKLDHDPRAHRIGAFLRTSSLDELPQFVNVLRGDMSIVGPRPIVLDEIPRYGDYVEYYLALRPGITGLWQVSRRSDTSYDERVKLDVRYCRTWTIGGDIAIIARTVAVLLTTQGGR